MTHQPVSRKNKLYFDRQDRELLDVIDRALEQQGSQESRDRAALNDLLHPHGILELATTHAERMAIAVVNLLGSLEAGQAEERLLALRSLHDEVLHSAQTTFRYNTGRVLIQMMKEIVRTTSDNYRRLMLAHDFRQVATGNPRIVRRFLKQYHLLEMPERWDQLAMDHHIHDSNTKGRKNPTHLIMDAWIKGLRFITVIYYNYVTPEAMRELFHAAEIMHMTVQIGIEFRCLFQNRAVTLVWEPTDFTDKRAALNFLADPDVNALMQEGRQTSAWLAQYVLHTLETWNNERRPDINYTLGLDIEPLPADRFLKYVGTGQASFLHLAEKLHVWILPSLEKRYQALAAELAALEHTAEPGKEAQSDENAEHVTELREQMHYLNALTPEAILHTWLSEFTNATLGPEPELSGAPTLLLSSPPEMLARFSKLYPNSNAWLNLAGLSPEDVLGLLWIGKGKITHLEIFNLKEWQEGRTPHLEEISRIQQALNEGAPLHLKDIVRALLIKNETQRAAAASCTLLREILRNITEFQAPYISRPLRSRIGTDSTSNSSMRHGMGLVLLETLPGRVQRQLRNTHDEARLHLPIHLTIFRRVSFLPPRRTPSPIARLGTWLRKFTGVNHIGTHQKHEWIVRSNTARIEKPGNVITIGGIGGITDNGFARRVKRVKRPKLGLHYLSTPLLNTLKVALGFIAAMLTFLYTQDWWLLAWYGAVIWFAITAIRNVIQAILSGGGIINTTLLRWNDYVSSTRICDSLMYTGFSVPLLEYVIRVALLGSLGFTVSNNPLLFFSIMAVANGFYIVSHNLYRGFPQEAIIGNMFRSVLAIPCAILYHDMLLVLLPYLGVAEPLIYLELGAAIVSKGASDTVAGLIEGFADRRNSLRLRYWDYKTKLTQVIHTYTRLDVAHPEADTLRLLSRPKKIVQTTDEETKKLCDALIINALDLMYFWHYKPRAQQALKHILRIMTKEERLILIRSQSILTQVREVSQLFVNGLVGEHFPKALAFYLDRHSAYLETQQALTHPHGEGTAKGLLNDDNDDDEPELHATLYDSSRAEDIL